MRARSETYGSDCLGVQVDALGGLFPVQLLDERADGFVADPLRVLHDHGVDHAVPEVLAQLIARIERNQLYFSGKPTAFHRQSRAQRTRLGGGEHPGEVGLGGQHVLGGGTGLSAIGHSVLRRHDADSRDSRVHDFPESHLPIHARLASRDVHQDRHLSLLIQQFGQGAGCQPAALDIVGGDIAGVVGRIEPGVEDGDRDALGDGSIDRADQRLALRRSERDAIDVLGDHRIDNLDLPAVVGLLRGAVPEDLDVELAACLQGSFVRRHPELVRGALGDDGDSLVLRTAAGSGG